MVEGQREPDLIPGKNADRAGVIPGQGLPRGPGDKDRCDRVPSRVPPRVGIRVELADELDVEGRLFFGFPDGRFLERFAVIDEAPGEGPAVRRVLSLDEDDAFAAPIVFRISMMMSTVGTGFLCSAMNFYVSPRSLAKIGEFLN